MKTQEFENKYAELQKEAKALAAELKPLEKKYKALARKASALGNRALNDNGLYRDSPDRQRLVGYNMETDGWNIRALVRLNDFEDECEGLLQDARAPLLNLAGEPFFPKKSLSEA